MGRTVRVPVIGGIDRGDLALGAVAGGVIAAHLALAMLSWWFPYGGDPRFAPTHAYLALAAPAGAAIPALIVLLPRLGPSRARLLAVFAVGALLRLVLFASTPVLEDDWHRYAWDGAVLAEGVDPYAYAPADAAYSDPLGEPIPISDDPDLAKLQALADENYSHYLRINYPFIKTIYPPIAQAAFLLSHKIAPFDFTAWRLVLLAADLLAFGLLLAALTAFGRNPLWSALYWWNPVVVLQAFNAGHMDVLVVPFLIGAMLAAYRARPAMAGALIAGAAAVKLWPLILAPALARPFLSNPGALARLALGGALVVPLLAPQILTALDPIETVDASTGLVAYSEGWRRNAFLFAVIADGFFGWMADPGGAARLFVAALVSVVAVVAALRSPKDGSGLPAAMALATGALLFLSPTGYPWYGIWLFAFLPFVPARGVALIAVTAPLYYTRFTLGDDHPLYVGLIVPFAFGLPLAVLAFDAFQQRSRRHVFA